MAWICPECGRMHEPPHKKCTCGYAYYQVLGIKDDAPPDSVEQTYRYLLKVWQKNADAQDPHALSKARARLTNINEAYAVFLQATGHAQKGTRDSTTVKFAVIGGIGLVIFVAFAFYFFSPSQKGSPPAVPESIPEQTAQQQKTASSLSVTHPRQELDAGQTQTASPDDKPDMQVEKTPDWAIASVRKSHVLDRVATVDLLVNKWMYENAGKLSPLGWTAKKMDENMFLVSYIVTDGITAEGLYFDINTETGEIRTVAGNPDLQRKYGITIKD